MGEDRYKVAIVGSGPGGMSAAARAAECGLPHILLEAAPHLSNTIYRYQKGKHVMAEPDALPLRSPIDFQAGVREKILQTWNEGIERLEVNVRFDAEVKSIGGERGNFDITLGTGDVVRTEHIVLGIGLQGNLRTLGVPGDDLERVQYQLDDPKEYDGETVVVVGAGDAAIENAVALADQNTVIIVNRSGEFTRAKEGNLDLIMSAISNDVLTCMFESRAVKVESTPASDGDPKPLTFTLSTPDGQAEIACDRIIARLGAIPPRRFVESCGIVFPNDDPAAVPAVNERYESNVPGLYIVGALAGYPLIKQAMNQGYEVVEFIQGKDVEPADEPLLRDRFSDLPGFDSVGDTLVEIQDNIRLFAGLTTLQLREFLLDSRIRSPDPGEVLFRYNDYTDTFFSILKGSVRVQVDPEDPSRHISLGKGQFFGEMSLISGRRRSATISAGPGCVVIETPRRSMNKLINSVESVKRIIDEAFLLRAIQGQIAPDLPLTEIDEVVRTATVAQFASGEVLFDEGDPGDSIHLIRRGSVTVSRSIGGRDVVFAYLPAGNHVGEMALLTDSDRFATVRAAVATETIRLEAEPFKALMERHPALQEKMRASAQLRLAHGATGLVHGSESEDVISFLVQQGIGEATDVLLIDESLCTRCDNCERACAETHEGTSRLDREAGPTYASIHVPTSCRHCEHPHCMKDCPPDAIHRAAHGEVYIADNCIGCGNCERNCPYGVIRMAYPQGERRSGLLSWLLFGVGEAPGVSGPGSGDASGEGKKATKCDMCKDLRGGPACVRACPTGAALRVSPESFLALTR
jgi:CRP-like cAMP-binding protein/Fe-S-cluster-containing hydrogenase component 2/thioredoxin reductase